MGPDRVDLVAALLLVGVLIGSVPQPGAAAGGFDPDVVAQADLETDATLMEVTLGADGSATWRIEYRTRLDDENTSEALDDLAADIEANRSAYTDRFATRMARTVADAENATGREMALESVDLRTSRTSIPEEYGGGGLDVLGRVIVAEELVQHRLGLYNMGLNAIEIEPGVEVDERSQDGLFVRREREDPGERDGHVRHQEFRVVEVVTVERPRLGGDRLEHAEVAEGDRDGRAVLRSDGGGVLVLGEVVGNRRRTAAVRAGTRSLVPSLDTAGTSFAIHIHIFEYSNTRI
jgi:hypothetical protein